MYEQLIEEISQKHHPAVSDIELCKQLFQPVIVPKNHLLEETGKIPRYLYYIISGFMRSFYYDDNGNEVTVHINCPHGFFTAFSEFVNQINSPINIETITDCKLLRINQSDYKLLMQKSLFWKDYGLYILQDLMKYNEDRSKDLANLTAEERYRKLMSTQPEILQNVPLQYIASFLGIKPESLSRIRRNLIN